MLKIAKDLFDLLYPVGTYYETSNANWTPSSAGWYGIWVEDTGGKTTVAKDNGTFKTLGASVGAETHILTINQMPKHKHKITHTGWYGTTPGSGRACMSNETISGDYPTPAFDCEEVGGTQAHNNIQPSIVVRRWHRTA